jgi:tRNA threonylcarbamoyladenosine biosynthesis protein TsaE
MNNNIRYFYLSSENVYSSFFKKLKFTEHKKSLIFLHGEIGAGKTLLVKSFIKHLDKRTIATSPTFTLINEYNIDNFKIFHYDLFRLNSSKELLEIGIDHYFSQEGIHFIEWPEKFLNLLPVSNYDIFFTILENSRLIKVIENY